MPPPFGVTPGQRPRTLTPDQLAALTIGGVPKEAIEQMAKDPRQKEYDAYDEEAGKGYAKTAEQLRNAGQAASKNANNLAIMEGLIRNVNTPMGMGAGVKAQLMRFGQMIGVAGGDLEKLNGLNNKEILDALAGHMALQLRNPAGGEGMPGAMSDSDREFLRSMTAGSANSPQASLFLLKMRQREGMRDLEIRREAQKWMANNGGRLDYRWDAHLDKWTQQHPLWSDEEKKALAGEHDQLEGNEPGTTTPGAKPTQNASTPEAGEVQTPGAAPVKLIKTPSGALQTVKQNADGSFSPIHGEYEAKKELETSPLGRGFDWLGQKWRQETPNKPETATPAPVAPAAANPGARPGSAENPIDMAEAMRSGTPPKLKAGDYFRRRDGKVFVVTGNGTTARPAEASLPNPGTLMMGAM